MLVGLGGGLREGSPLSRRDSDRDGLIAPLRGPLYGNTAHACDRDPLRRGGRARLAWDVAAARSAFVRPMRGNEHPYDYPNQHEPYELDSSPARHRPNRNTSTDP